MNALHSDLQNRVTRPESHQMLPAETRLWQALRAHRFHGLAIRRQAPVGPYLAPFYLPALRAVIETDERPPSLARKAWLHSQGYRIYRLPALAVLGDLPAVLDLLSEDLLPQGAPAA